MGCPRSGGHDFGCYRNGSFKGIANRAMLRAPSSDRLERGRVDARGGQPDGDPTTERAGRHAVLDPEESSVVLLRVDGDFECVEGDAQHGRAHRDQGHDATRFSGAKKPSR